MPARAASLEPRRQWGVSQSALSQTIKSLEERLQIRLLTRTTRSISPTPEGERLLSAIGSRFDEIEAELDALTTLRAEPAGSVRITCGEHVLSNLLLPRLMPLMGRYPDVNLEFEVYYGLRDIVKDRFDAGVRLGESIDRDMIALPIGPPLRMSAAASPAYFEKHPIPRSPEDLSAHRCINIRLPTNGGLYVWEFEQGDRRINVRVEGQAIFNTSPHIVMAALDGLGIAFLPEEEFEPHIEQGRLVRVLEDWCPPFPGYHLYYPSRKQHSPAFSLIIEALRFR